MKTAFKVALMVALPLSLTAAAASDEREEIGDLTEESLIVDEEDVLDTENLVGRINELDPAGVRIGVLVSDEASADDYDATITARLTDLGPDELIDNGRLAEDATVIVLSPELRQFGIYSGDEAQDAESTVDVVTDAMRPYAQDAQWEDAIVSGVEAYLNETYHAEDSVHSGTNDLAEGDMVLGLGVIGGLFVLGVGSVVIIVYTKAMDRRKYRQSYPSTKAHVDEAYRLFSRICSADTAKVPGAPSRFRSEEIVDQLRTVISNGYQPTEKIRGDRRVRQWTDDLTKAREVWDKIDVVEFNDAGQRRWHDGLRQRVADVADFHEVLLEEIEDQPFTEEERMRLRGPLSERAREAHRLIDQVEGRKITAYEAIETAERLHDTTERELISTIRGIPATRRARFSEHDSNGGAINAAVLWPTVAASAAVSTTGSSSASGMSVSTTSFSGGGFSGGSSGF